MSHSRAFLVNVVGALAFVSVMLSSAQAATFDSTDNGWYREVIFDHGPANTNIYTGDNIGREFRSFLTFDLTSAAGMTVISGTLTLFSGNGIFASPDPQETYRIFDYTGSIPDLVAGTGGSTAFDDLGTGSSYGQTVVNSPGQNLAMPTVTVALTAAALSDINTLLTGALFDFALGGVCTTCGMNQAFWSGSLGVPAGQLSLEFASVSPVPLPAALPLFITVLAGMGFLRWWKRRAA